MPRQSPGLQEAVASEREAGWSQCASDSLREPPVTQTSERGLEASLLYHSCPQESLSRAGRKGAQTPATAQGALIPSWWPAQEVHPLHLDLLRLQEVEDASDGETMW